MTIVGVVLALLGSRRLTALLLLAIACWLGFELAPQWTLPDDPPSIGVRPLRIYFDDIWTRSPHGRRSSARSAAADADVVALVQVSDLNAPFVRQALSSYRYHLESAAATDGNGSRRVILAARFPLKALPAPDHRPVEPRRSSRPRSLAAKPIHLVIVRLKHPWPDPGQDEILQQLAARLSGGRAAHAVVVGDFNATLSSVALRRFVHETGLTPLRSSSATGHRSRPRPCVSAPRTS